MAGRHVLRHDAEVSAGHFAVLQDLVHDVAGQVHRNGEADALVAFRAVRDDGGVDADQFAAVVDQRAAGVAGIDGRVGLDEVFIVFDAQVGAAGGADDPHGHRLAHAERDCRRPARSRRPGLSEIADHDGGQIGGVDLEDGDVGLGIGADDAGFDTRACRRA